MKTASQIQARIKALWVALRDLLANNPNGYKPDALLDELRYWEKRLERQRG